MTRLDASALAQLDAVVDRFNELRRRSKYDDLSDLTPQEYTSCIAAARAAIERVSGKGSAYVEQTESILQFSGGTGFCGHASPLAGIAKALREDVANGYLQNLRELAHGDLFADFLEMAEHLLESGYKDAAAVISGSALGAHLRQVADKHGVPVTVAIKGVDVPKKTDRLNGDLASVPVYGKLEQKSVTAWLGLRNDAAHGNYGAYTNEQVRLHIEGIRDFIVRHPA